MNNFQKDLCEGMTLQEALVKHGLTLREAFEKCNHGVAGVNKSKYYNIYLDRNTWSFRVERTVNKKCFRVGGFEELDDAVLVRDFLDEYGWTVENIERIKRKRGVKC